MTNDDDFYIGYESPMPRRLRGAVTVAVAVAIVVGLSAAVVFVSQQRRMADSRFEFGTVRTFTGYLSLSPAPALIIDDGSGPRPHWLVAPGKFGAAAVLGPVRPGWVTLSGTLIERERWRMIEVRQEPVELHATGQAPPADFDAPARPVVVTGEIVDGKCYLGVMNPGERQVHRDCALRCLDGGVPAMFAYEDSSGSHLALMVGADAAIRQQHVGRPVRLSGHLSGPEDALIFSVGKAY